MRHSQRKVIREEWEREIKEHKTFLQCKKKYKVFLALGGGTDEKCNLFLFLIGICVKL